MLSELFFFSFATWRILIKITVPDKQKLINITQKNILESNNSALFIDFFPETKKEYMFSKRK